MTASRGRDTLPGDLFFPLSESKPLQKEKYFHYHTIKNCFLKKTSTSMSVQSI